MAKKCPQWRPQKESLPLEDFRFDSAKYATAPLLANRLAKRTGRCELIH